MFKQFWWLQRSAWNFLSNTLLLCKCDFCLFYTYVHHSQVSIAHQQRQRHNIWISETFLVNSISWTFEYLFYEICNDASNSLISMCYGFLQQIRRIYDYSKMTILFFYWKLFSAHRYLSTDDLGTKLILFFMRNAFSKNLF